MFIRLLDPPVFHRYGICIALVTNKLQASDITGIREKGGNLAVQDNLTAMWICPEELVLACRFGHLDRVADR